MTSIIADSNLQAALGGFVEPVEIRDPNGNLLGHFTPARSDEGRLYEQARKQFDPAELKRRNDANGPGITTAQLLAKLETLESP
ncbi:MAG: hypothetical protein WD875_16070 [Pirellulales bacterium]